MQTSIMAVQFEGGVVVGADSRTTMGSYIVRAPIRIYGCALKYPRRRIA
jgi:20S proteasome alpha/beta subunit